MDGYARGVQAGPRLAGHGADRRERRRRAPGTRSPAAADQLAGEHRMARLERRLERLGRPHETEPIVGEDVGPRELFEGLYLLTAGRGRLARPGSNRRLR